MTSGNKWREEKRARRYLTPLNLATSAAYTVCNGAHTPSGDTVTRDFAGDLLQLPVCQHCGVPYGKVKGWGSTASAKRGVLS